MHAYAAATVNVPLVFVSGDDGICEEAALLIPQIATLAVKRGVGDASINIHPHLAVDQIMQRVQTALQEDVSKCRLPLPAPLLYRMSHYPAQGQSGDTPAGFFDYLRYLWVADGERGWEEFGEPDYSTREAWISFVSSRRLLRYR